MAKQKQGYHLEPTYSSSVRIRDLALRTSQKRWTIGRSGDRGSGISLLAARQDDDDYIVALYGWPEQTIPLSVLARNQTKDFWTWNLAVSGSGKRTWKESWVKKRSWEAVGDGTAGRRVSRRVGVEPRRDAVDFGDSSREDRVQRRRSSQEMSAFQLLVKFSLVTHASVGPHMHVVLHTPPALG